MSDLMILCVIGGSVVAYVAINIIVGIIARKEAHLVFDRYHKERDEE